MAAQLWYYDGIIIIIVLLSIFMSKYNNISTNYFSKLLNLHYVFSV